jgi:hypothetical protein
MGESGAARMPEIEVQLFQSLSDAMPYDVCLLDLQGKVDSSQSVDTLIQESE